MDPIVASTLAIFEKELTDLLDRCNGRDQIITHFSQYFVRQIHLRQIEDFNLDEPIITQTDISIKTSVTFAHNLVMPYTLVIRKRDNAHAAWKRAIGVI